MIMYAKILGSQIQQILAKILSNPCACTQNGSWVTPKLHEMSPNFELDRNL